MMNPFNTLKPLYIVVLDADQHVYKNNIYGYYFDEQIAHNEVEWLKKELGIDARVEINTIETRQAK